MHKKLKEVVYAISPARSHLPLHYWFRKIGHRLDDEMFLLPQFMSTKDRVVDVGSNIGIYSYFFSGHVKRVDSFEPIREVSRLLRDSGLANVEVHDCALSRMVGEGRLFIPFSVPEKLNWSLSSLETRGDVKVETRAIEVRTLDSFGYHDVSLLKIDVEGHEVQVLEGGLETIKACRPILFIEIEQRHAQEDVHDRIRFVEKLGYAGFFLRSGSLVPVSKFRYEKHQEPFLENVMDKRYVNNFFFFPKERQKKKARCSKDDV